MLLERKGYAAMWATGGCVASALKLGAASAEGSESKTRLGGQSGMLA